MSLKNCMPIINRNSFSKFTFCCVGFFRLLCNRYVNCEIALQSLLNYLQNKNSERLFIQTQIIIAPGYSYKITNGIVTNFHQPKSTLLLLVAAMIGQNWKRIYDYALMHEFRFLSYGDGCLIFSSREFS